MNICVNLTNSCYSIWGSITYCVHTFISDSVCLHRSSITAAQQRTSEGLRPVLTVLSTQFSGSAFYHNTTVCPIRTVPGSVLNFGFCDDGIPSDLHRFLPVLLNVDTVDVFEDLMVGAGGQARLYLGRFLPTDEDVVVKVLLEENLEELMNEATMMIYLEDIPHIPLFRGLLPVGPLISDLAIVMEFIPNSTTVYDLLLHGALSQCDWLNFSQQLSTALLEMHKRFVLFNDLHDRNIIVSRQGAMLKVYVIDFADASFRQGNSFMENFTQGSKNPFPSPEAHFGITTPASDVFSLGMILAHITDYVNNKDFYRISQHCVAGCPSDRPPLYNVNDFLVELYKDTCKSASNTLRN
ncbi:serine/threonine-protein kinase PrkC-like [Haliotis cracherodii]|uniref:serine/threonine-protein kinase PrkC-like n=1 Tax=Haliotis cracherodii TaxID=6455 RepID=UPI0039EC7E22